tara:strand:+ start:4526 stop:5479 length:954 start_codon:yes stop_codon:yes gene_type:complete
MLKKFRAFKNNKLGILNLNTRNGNFINTNNSRKDYPSVDNKLITKDLAIKNNIPVPEAYAVIKSNKDLRNIKKILKKYNEFVVKPASGSGGNGILIITGKYENYYQKNNKELITEDDLMYHISNILSGMYSLGNHQDQALIEYKVNPSQIFAEISTMGVPDIRIIVYKKIPAMAMLRLPTNLSNGKANLHQGALGIGINFKNGTLTGGVFKKKLISYHPDTLQDFKNFEIPNWYKILLLAQKCGNLTNLGYIGVDIVIDKDKGPLILELNARPGLSIQLANNSGLLQALNLIDNFIIENKNNNITNLSSLNWCINNL